METLLLESLQDLGIEIIEENVGEGGSAHVHKGRVVNQTLDGIPDPGTTIAIKEFKETLLSEPRQVQRIRQEAAIGSQILHPNFVKVYCAHIPEEPTEKHYLFLEWLDGETLGPWARKLRKNVAWERVRNVCLAIGAAVEELHTNGIYHRDIKPENVMFQGDVPKLMDVGVAEITSENEHSLHTPMGEFLGSVRYASPQYILGEEFTPADDVYSLGATILETLTGEPPYQDVSRKPQLPIIVTQGPPKVGELRDNVPGHIRILLQGCLHRDRNRRPTLEEIRTALEADHATDYVQRESDRQAADRRGYPIIRLHEESGGFFADIGADHPDIDREYVVIRRGGRMSVPSLGTDVEPEIWVASAELRHYSQNVGHFKLLGKRWVKDRSHGFLSVTSLMGTGHWEDSDKKDLQVTLGDFVLKKEYE